MRMRLGVSALLILGLACCLWAAPIASAGVNPTFSGPFYSQQTTFGFERPIGMAVAPGGRIFITDDKGIVWTSMGGGAKAKPIFDLSDHVNEIQDRGLISVAVDKNYSLNRKIYLAYTFEDRSESELEAEPSLAELPKTERLVWVEVPSELELEALTEPIKLEPEDEHVVLGSYSSDSEHPGVPFSTEHACPQPSNLVSGDWTTSNESDCIPDDSVEHTIDSVRVDPNDGTLWVSVGDGSDGGAALDPDSWRSQRVESYSGKLLHISTNGKGLPGRPFCPSDENLTDVCTKVYAKGFRNPFRFFLRPSPDGRPTVADAGWSTREELDLAEKGKNYGWPCREGKIPAPTWSEEPQCEALLKEETPTEPIYDYPNLTGGAILGGITYTGTGGPNDYPEEYKGAIFISDFVTNEVKYLRLNEAGTAVEPGYPKVFADNLMAVDWAPAPNGDLMYVDIGFGPSEFAQIRKISFDSENAPPEAVATANKNHGALPLTVKFDASASTDPDEDPLTYEWDLNGDGETDSTSAKPEWTYEEDHNVEVTLRVKDGHGHEGVATMELYPGDEAPVPKFNSGPSTYTDGEEITLTGSAQDPEDGALAVGALAWNVKLNHGGSHIHPWASPEGVDTVKFTTDTAHDSPSFYVVELTATDSRGLATTITRKIEPKTQLVHIDSTPKGAPIVYGGLNQTAPYEKQSTIGLHTTVSAAPSFEQGGELFEFERWLNEEPRIWELEVPGEDVSLTAVYASVELEPELEVNVTGEGSVSANEPPVPLSGGIAGCEEGGGSECEAVYTEGDEVTLVATPEVGWEPTGWTGCAELGADECKVTMNANKTVSVTFEEEATEPEPETTPSPTGQEGGGGTTTEPPLDTSAPKLAFNPKHGLANKRKAALRGIASDGSGLGKVQVALRQKRKVGGKCRWWSQGKHGFPRGGSSCGHPAYMTAKLQGSGEKVTWILPLGGHLPKGVYLLFFRTEDQAGNVGFGPGGKRPVPLKVG